MKDIDAILALRAAEMLFGSGDASIARREEEQLKAAEETQEAYEPTKTLPAFTRAKSASSRLATVLKRNSTNIAPMMTRHFPAAAQSSKEEGAAESLVSIGR